jgi:hypothetical protein
VSVVVGRLVARGLVAKVVSPDDRRRQSLVVTAAGRRALAGASPAVQERLIDTIGGLPAGDRRQLARLLGIVATGLAPETVGTHPPMLFEEAKRPGRRRPVRRPRRPRSQS